MCGITGIYSFGNREKSWPIDCLNRMMQGIRHRGPDGLGSHTEPGFFIGHARLAVLDLSPAARQPMFSHDKRFVVSCNGELYNFRELRADLEKAGHVFTTRSDTEVLLAAWCEWGERALEKFNGIFAFALFDRRDRALYLVRDHVGVKPLYYQIHDDSVFFSSELLPLFSAISPCPDENPEDLDTYFTFNYLPAPRTGLKGVMQLPPGSLLRVDRQGGKLERYWTPHYTTELLPWNAQTVDCFKATLCRSVKSQTVSDVPLGLFLSGGLDSYAVGLAAIEAGVFPHAFTLGFAEPGFDETPAALAYSRYLNITHQLVQFSWNESVIEKTLGAMGELLADASSFPLYQLSEFARRDATVVLAGDGGDELLAGYDTYLAGELTPLVRRIPAPVKRVVRSVTQHLPTRGERYGLRMKVQRLFDASEAGPRRDHASFRRIFSDDLKMRLYRPEFRSAVSTYDPLREYTDLMDQVPAGRSFLTARQHADLAFHLPSVLAKVDRMSMVHGLEVRVPFLGREMLEFCINLDDAAKRTLTGGKQILRKALAGSIPERALRMPKAGFLPPVDNWFRNDGPMNTIFGDYLVTARTSSATLKWDEVEQFWQEHRQGKVDGGFVLLGILQYINWSIKCRRV